MSTLDPVDGSSVEPARTGPPEPTGPPLPTSPPEPTGPPEPTSPPEPRGSAWTRSVGVLGGPALPLIALFAALVPVIGWLNRGIDLLDEGYYLLGYRHPRDVFLTLSHFHHLVAALTGGRAWPILFYRLLGLVVSVASSIFLAIQVHRFVPPSARAESRSRWVSLAAFTALGGLLCYTVGPRSLSYNGLSNACMLVEVGLTLSLLSAGARTPWTRAWIAGMLGATFGAHVMIKATSAGLMGGWVLCAALLLGLGGPRRWVATAASGILGAVVFAATFFAWIVPYRDWWTGISLTRAAMSAQYSPAALAASSLRPVATQFALAGPRLLLSMGLAAAGVWVLRGTRAWLAWVCFVLALFLTLWTALDSRMFSGFIRHGMDGGIPFVMLMALAMTVWLVSRVGGGRAPRAEAETSRRTRLIALLLPLPVLAALGTNNALSIQILLHLAPWFAVLWLLAEDSATRVAEDSAAGLAENPAAGPAGVWIELIAVAAAVIAMVEIGGSQLTHPYRLPGGTLAQVEAFSPRIEAGGGVTVDVNTRSLVEDTRDLLDRNGFRPGDPVLVLYDLPGLVYLVGGRSPRLPWFFSGSEALACRAIALASDELGRDRLFILARGGISRPVRASLEDAGVGNDLLRIGTVKNQRFGDIEIFMHRAAR